MNSRDPLIAFVERLQTHSLDDARLQIWRAMARYVMEPEPDHMLLIKAPPGVGKSHAAMMLTAEPMLARKRILYAGPRRNFFPELQRLAIKTGQNPNDWLEWQPRQLEDEEAGRCQTCVHAPFINTWLSRGHESFHFCRQICGLDYLNKECVYHSQSRTKLLRIYGHFNHVFGGHPLEFHLVIGDESPLSSAMRKWLIPGHEIIPGGYDPFDRSPAHEMLAALQNLAVSYPSILQGKELLDALGGADVVKEAAGSLSLSPDNPMLSPRIHQPEQGAEAPYGHVFPLMQLLRREAEEALQGNEYLTRVIVENGKLLLLLRKSPDKKMPKHVIWLDATGNEHIYKALFNRDVKVIEPNVPREGKVYQVTNHANGKSTMTEEGSEKVPQTLELIARLCKERGYKNVGVITFLAIEEEFEKAGYQTMHFGAETGSNLFRSGSEKLDALFVVGTPMPSQQDLQGIAKMVFFDRMTPFQSTWSNVPKPFTNHWRVENKRVGGFWSDADLQAVLWQHRNAKIIQAAHRAGINIQDVDVWLFTNLPITELAPDETKTITELWGGPREGVEWEKWKLFVEVGIRICLENERLYGERNAIRRELMAGAKEIKASTRVIREYWKHARELFKNTPVHSDFSRKPKRGPLPNEAIDFTKPIK